MHYKALCIYSHPNCMSQQREFTTGFVRSDAAHDPTMMLQYKEDPTDTSQNPHLSMPSLLVAQSGVQAPFHEPASALEAATDWHICTHTPLTGAPQQCRAGRSKWEIEGLNQLHWPHRLCAAPTLVVSLAKDTACDNADSAGLKHLGPLEKNTRKETAWGMEKAERERELFLFLPEH